MISYFDAHCDTVSRCLINGWPMWANPGHLDLERCRNFGRYAQFFALYYNPNHVPADGLWAQCLRMYQMFLREMEANADLICHCRTADQVEETVADGRMAALLSIEGADLLECNPERIDTLAAWGVRLMNPVWNHANILCGTNKEDTDRGLSRQGRDFIHRLEEKNISVDVSHISDPGFWDVVRTARRPVVASHSNSRALCPHPRNLTDDMFRALRDSGGIVGINLYRDFVGQSGSMEELVAHVDHFLSLDGEKALCIGGDLDGCDHLAGGVRGVQDVSRIYEALAQRGYSESLLEDIFWNNLMRII